MKIPLYTGCFPHNRGVSLYTYLSVKLGLHAPLDAEHLPEGVFVAMVNLKLLPRLPVRLTGLKEREVTSSLFLVCVCVCVPACLCAY